MGEHVLRRGSRVSWRSLATRSGLVRVILALDLFLLADAVVFLAVRAPTLPAVQAGALPSFEPGNNVGAVQPPPVQLDIDSVGVHTPLVDLARNADGTLETPRDFAVAGWFARGVAPGANGSAVIVGHVDSTKGPAVFHRLRELVPGSTVAVTRLDGRRLNFVVEAVQQFSKDTFPTQLVYASGTTPLLRLITCGGRFDRRTRSYTDNVVAFARLATPEITT